MAGSFPVPVYYIKGYKQRLEEKTRIMTITAYVLNIQERRMEGIGQGRAFALSRTFAQK